MSFRVESRRWQMKMLLPVEAPDIAFSLAPGYQLWVTLVVGDDEAPEGGGALLEEFDGSATW